MLFKGLNNENLHFDLAYTDYAKLTGYVGQSEITRLSLYLNYKNRQTASSILVSDVLKIIEWFENLTINKIVEQKILVFNKQLYFDLLKNNFDRKVIRITYDTTVPTSGKGAYSLSPGAKREHFSTIISVKCEMDNLEVERVVKKLKAELQIELELGNHIESKKPK